MKQAQPAWGLAGPLRGGLRGARGLQDTAGVASALRWGLSRRDGAAERRGLRVGLPTLGGPCPVAYAVSWTSRACCRPPRSPIPPRASACCPRSEWERRITPAAPALPAVRAVC